MTRHARREELRREQEAREWAEAERRNQRIRDCWIAPERAREEYIALEDAVGAPQAEAIHAYLVTLIGEPAE